MHASSLCAPHLSWDLLSFLVLSGTSCSPDNFLVSVKYAGLKAYSIYVQINISNRNLCCEEKSYPRKGNKLVVSIYYRLTEIPCSITFSIFCSVWCSWNMAHCCIILNTSLLIDDPECTSFCAELELFCHMMTIVLFVQSFLSRWLLIVTQFPLSRIPISIVGHLDMTNIVFVSFLFIYIFWMIISLNTHILIPLRFASFVSVTNS